VSDALAGKVAIVSGAARGQGRSHAERLAADGADVIVLDNCADLDSAPYAGATRADLDATVAAVAAAGRRAVPAVVDVRDADATAAAVREGVAELGRLDVVVANAGIVSYHPADELPRATWTETIDTNLTGVWNLVQPSLRPLIDQGEGGSIVITSSTAALTGLPHLPHYSAAKAGLVGLMQSLAVELGPHRIRVNTVHPTAVDTPMVRNDATYELMSGGTEGADAEGNPPPLAVEALTGQNSIPVMWVESEDVANAVAFLASDASRYVTGTKLKVDAGSVVK
jgi:SDR family mycofactocin-dependent oxidoreductase